MKCELCKEDITDTDFLVGVGPEATDTSGMIVGHTICVNKMVEAIKDVLKNGLPEEED